MHQSSFPIFDDWHAKLTSIFVTHDVAVVYFLAVMPLAAFLLMYLQRASMPIRVIAIAVPAMGLLLMQSGANETGSPVTKCVNANLLRTVVALSMAMAVGLITIILLRLELRPRLVGRDLIISLGVWILIASILPTVYVHARCRHDMAILEGLVGQSRVAEAQKQLHELVRLDPSIEYRGRPLRNMVAEIDRLVLELECQVAIPLSASASEDQVLERCRQLAMLGRTSDALDRLRPLLNSLVGPSACDLCGTICETTAEWETARDSHRRAKEAWLRRPSSVERSAGLLRAATRLGYCERKLGHYELAEAEYLEVIAQSPTADNHFLLAQFYEDMQQSNKARNHARRAMTLAPQRYSREGSKLIDKLMISHFGCLGVYSAESKDHVPAGSSAGFK